MFILVDIQLRTLNVLIFRGKQAKIAFLDYLKGFPSLVYFREPLSENYFFILTQRSQEFVPEPREGVELSIFGQHFLLEIESNVRKRTFDGTIRSTLSRNTSKYFIRIHKNEP
jgi:hypothetical protein